MVEFLKAARRASHGQSSFPRYIADLIIAACNRGATDVLVKYSDGCVEVADNGRPIAVDEIRRGLSFDEGFAKGSLTSDAGKLLGFLHHAGQLSVWTNGLRFPLNRGDIGHLDMLTNYGVEAKLVGDRKNIIQLAYLGNADGVNATQARTPKQLITRLPALLSPRELARVLLDDGMATRRLGTASREPITAGEYVVWLPFKLQTLNTSQTPLMLKVGGVRVPMRKFIERLRPGSRPGYMQRLCSPWLGGTMEITRKDGASEFLEALDDFPDVAYENGFAEVVLDTLVNAGVPTIIRDENVQLLRSLVEAESDENWCVEFNGMKYFFRVGESTHAVSHVSGHLAGIWNIEFGACAAIYHIDNRADAIIERLYWQAAIALWEAADKRGDPSDVYLRLRATINSANNAPQPS